MKISVAMATYNGERFVREQLDSLATQTRPPDQLIVVDDCSSDRTLDIVAEFARTAPFSVMTYRNEQNLGWSGNFLKAISLCDGDWIALCDQDDVWMSAKLSTIEYHIAAEGSESDVVLWVHSARVVDDCLRPSRVLFPDIRRRRILKGTRLPIWLFYPGFSLVLSGELGSLLCDFASARGADPSDQSMPMAHDRYICQVAKSAGAVGTLPDILAVYRRHGGTTTHTFRGGNEQVHASVGFGALVKHSLLVGGANSYTKHSEAARRLSGIVKRLAGEDKARKWRERLVAAGGEFNAFAEWTATRSGIYRETSAGARLRHFVRAAYKRGYVRFYGIWWLLGARALAKDFFVALVGSPRTDRPKVGEFPPR